MRVAPQGLLPEGTHARYFGRDVEPNSILLLKWFKTSDERFGILLNPSILDSDDAIVAVLAHEVYETQALEMAFLANGGQLTAERVHFLVNTETGVLHCQAWDHADELVRRRHGSEDG